MRYMCLFAGLILSCQSQADKDRAEMEKLLEKQKTAREALEECQYYKEGELFKAKMKRLETLNKYAGTDLYPIMRAKAYADESVDTLIIKLRYDSLCSNDRYALFKINERIEELKLLMGK